MAKERSEKKNPAALERLKALSADTPTPASESTEANQQLGSNQESTSGEEILVMSNLEDYFKRNPKFEGEKAVNVALFKSNHNRIVTALNTHKESSIQILLNNIVDNWFDQNKTELEKQLKKLMKL